MKYIGNPVEVDAFRIRDVHYEERPMLGYVFILQLEDHANPVIVTKEMTARLIPTIGDYWVRQADGYVYLNPKDVFERKYRPATNGTGSDTQRMAYIERLNAFLDRYPDAVPLSSEHGIAFLCLPA